MDDRTRYESVKSRLRAMGLGTAEQVRDAMEPTPYSVREVENTLAEMALAEQDEFEKVGAVYRWKKHYRFRMGAEIPWTIAKSDQILLPFANRQ